MINFKKLFLLVSSLSMPSIFCMDQTNQIRLINAVDQEWKRIEDITDLAPYSNQIVASDLNIGEDNPIQYYFIRDTSHPIDYDQYSLHLLKKDNPDHLSLDFDDDTLETCPLSVSRLTFAQARDLNAGIQQKEIEIFDENYQPLAFPNNGNELFKLNHLVAKEQLRYIYNNSKTITTLGLIRTLRQSPLSCLPKDVLKLIYPYVAYNELKAQDGTMALRFQ